VRAFLAWGISAAHRRRTIVSGNVTGKTTPLLLSMTEIENFREIIREPLIGRRRRHVPIHNFQSENLYDPTSTDLKQLAPEYASNLDTIVAKHAKNDASKIKIRANRNFV
jgi:hypothetical protein